MAPYQPHFWIQASILVLLAGEIVADVAEKNVLFDKNRFSLDDRKMNSCGDPRWRAWYTELVHRIREDSMPPRYLINVHEHTGLADRLVRVATLDLHSTPEQACPLPAYIFASLGLHSRVCLSTSLLPAMFLRV